MSKKLVFIYALFLIIVFLLQIYSSNNQLVLNQFYLDDHNFDKKNDLLSNSIINNSYENNTRVLSESNNNISPITQTNLQKSSSSSITSSSSLNNYQSVRVDYQYDNIYPVFYDMQFFGTCSSTCNGGGFFDAVGNIVALDSTTFDIVIRAGTTTTATYSWGAYYYFKFDVTNFISNNNATGTVYINNIKESKNAVGTVYLDKIYIYSSYGGSTYWQKALTSSYANYSISNPQYINDNSRNLISGFGIINFATDASINANHQVYANIDQIYFQPDIISTYPVMTSTYQDNGKFIDSVTVHPSASGSVTIYNSTNTVFSTASNAYSSVSVDSNGSTVLTGLPNGVDTTVYFSVDESQNAYPIYENNSITLNSSSNTYQFQGKGSYYLLGNLTINSSNAYLLGHYLISFGFWSITSTALQLYYKNGNYEYRSYVSVNKNRWNFNYFAINIDSYNSGIAFVINSTDGYGYLNTIHIFRYNNTVTNNIVNSDLKVTSNLYYLTDYGLIVAPNEKVNGYVLDSLKSNLYSITGYTDQNGYFQAEFPLLNAGNYYLEVSKNGSSVNEATFGTNYIQKFDSFEYTTISDAYTSGWVDNSGGANIFGSNVLNGSKSLKTVGSTLDIYLNRSYSSFIDFDKVSFFNVSVSIYQSSSFKFYFWIDDVDSYSASCQLVSGHYENCNWNKNNVAISSLSADIGLASGWNELRVWGTVNLNSKIITPHFLFNGVSKSSTSISVASLSSGAGLGYSVTAYDNFELIQSGYITGDAKQLFSISDNNSISYTLNENNIGFILSKDEIGGNLYINAWQDNVYQGSYKSNDLILKLTTGGSHEFAYKFYYADNYAIGITDFINLTYSVFESDIETLIFRDQNSRYINPDTFNVWVDSVRIVGGSFYRSDTSSTFNLTITDAWGTSVYQNTSDTWIRIKDVTVTLYSVKVQNYQSDPVLVMLKQASGNTYSSWCFPQEVLSYNLIGANYNITWSYGTVNNQYVVSTNTTTASYSWTLASDIAFRINGNNLADIYNSVIEAIGQNTATQQQIANINATITSQIINVGFNLTNINSSIYSQQLDIIFQVNNTNTSIISQLNSMSLNITNLETQINSQTNTINDSINNLKTNITVQFNDINTTISNVNSNVLSQASSIISNLQDVNSSIYAQTISILNNLSISNSDVYNQTVQMLSQISLVNSTLYNQAVEILTKIISTNSSIFEQNVQIQNFVYLQKILNFDYHVYEDNVFVYVSTTYTNTSVEIYEKLINGTFNLIVSGSEGFLNFTKNSDPGEHRIYVNITFTPGFYTIAYNFSYSTSALSPVIINNNNVVTTTTTPPAFTTTTTDNNIQFLAEQQFVTNLFVIAGFLLFTFFSVRRYLKFSNNVSDKVINESNKGINKASKEIETRFNSLNRKKVNQGLRGQKK